MMTEAGPDSAHVAAGRELRRGDVVEVRGAGEILQTLDENGMLEGMPFMPEMLQYIGRRYIVDKRAQKVCDTIAYYTSRRVPDAVLLEDLRCDGSGHDGCQAECRLFWKDAWLRKVNPGEPVRTVPNEEAFARLADLVGRTSRVNPGSTGQTVYRCQATEMFRASEPVRTLDPRPYLLEYTSGNVGLLTFIKVVAQAAVVEPLRKLGLMRMGPLRGSPARPAPQAALNLRPGELVQVKSREEITRTLGPDRKNRGMYFDVNEMFPFCGGTYRVRQRVNRFIDDRNGAMVQLKTDAVTLDNVVCSGEHSTARWFCPRAIFPYWREAWLTRVEAEPQDAEPANVRSPAG